MIKISKQKKNEIISLIKLGKIDRLEFSFPNLVDEMALKMHEEGLISFLNSAFIDKRSSNSQIPLEILLSLSIIAKMKIKTSLTDIPCAITDADTLAQFGYNLISDSDSLRNDLFSEGTVRNFVSKYDSSELISSYNTYLQDFVLPHFNLQPSIHILDCTKIEVNFDNSNYENADVALIHDKTLRGYKLATLRGLLDDGGIMEEIKLGPASVHDLELSRDLFNSKVLNKGDILIEDRGFISRESINYLKKVKQVDVYIPARSNMDIYKEAVQLANIDNNWTKHPSREKQHIALVSDLGQFWTLDGGLSDVNLNGCVVREKKNEGYKYFVFLTTDLTKGAKEIIKIYETRAEIEEEYRQIKDFWQLEGFSSTKYNFVTFHIVTVMIGYLYFQLYKNMKDGGRLSGKSLPVVMKNFKLIKPKKVIVYSGEYYGILEFVEFLDIYDEATKDVKLVLREYIS